MREIELTRRMPEAPQEAFVWVGLHEPDQAHMQEVADVFGLHPLAVEDAVHAHQRPKLERYDDTLFLVLKTVNYVPHESVVLAREIVETGEVMVFVGSDFVVTVRHGEHGGLTEVRKRMDASPEHLRRGPYAVMHAIADHVVDHYLEVTDLMESDIDGIEEFAFGPSRKLDVEPIYLLKREVVELRRCVNPLSGAFQRMQTENKDLICKEVRRYLRDVADHHSEAADQIASYDDMLNSLVQAALARVGMQQNSDMRKISAWAAIVGGADHDRRHLRHELRVHARAEVALGLPGGGRRHGHRLPGPVLHLPQGQAGSSWSSHLFSRADTNSPNSSACRAFLRLVAACTVTRLSTFRW